MLLLRYYSGLKFREIAARLNLPISNVYARLDSACGMLRRLLFCDSRWSWLREEFRDQFSFGGIVSKIAIPDRGQSNPSAIGSNFRMTSRPRNCFVYHIQLGSCDRS